MLNENGMKVFEARYAGRDENGNINETFEQAVDRLVNSVYNDKHPLYKDTRDAILNLELVPSTPIWANVGKNDRPWQPGACFVLDIEDSLDDMYRALKDTALIFKSGGGIGYNFSSIRPKGSLVMSTKGKASGVVELIKLYDASSNMVMQGGVRRGASMGILNVDHPEIMDFINCKRDGGITNFNLSVGITDEFMKALELDTTWDLKFGGKVYKTVYAREIWDAIAEAAHACGDPGLIFLDAIQVGNPVPGDKLDKTNPCVVGTTKIRTTNGVFEIQDLVGKEVDVYCMDNDGNLAISRAHNIRKTKENAPLVELITTRGTLRCTPDHKAYTKNRGYVEAQHLTRKDRIVGLNMKCDDTYTAVGLTGQKYIREHRFVAGHYYNIKNMNVHHKDGNKHNNVIDILEVLTHSEHSVVTNMGHPHWVTQDERGRFSGSKGLRTGKKYNTSLGRQVGVNLRLKEVRHLEETADVYDMTVGKYHNYLADDIIVHNCGEQPLVNGESCLLLSVNLAKIMNGNRRDLQKLDRLTRLATRFLDALIDVAEYPLPVIDENTRATRKIGIGFTGLHDALIMAGLPYDSPKGRKFAAEITALMSAAAKDESMKLAEELGPFPKWEQSIYYPDTPIRNASRITIAPTGSVTAMAGCEGYGVEPIFGIAYKKATNVAGDFYVFSPLFLEVCKKHNVPQEVLDEVGRRGSCQGVEGIPIEIQRIFKGAMDIHYKDHIAMQAAVQKYVDNAVSKTINLPNTATVEMIKDCYKMAYDMDCKGITVYRDGCKEGVVTVGTPEEKQIGPVRGEVVPRPYSTQGVTRRLDTGCGKLYLTANFDDDGNIIETFITTGSDGGCLIFTEATSRLISLVIRGGIPIEEIIEQLNSTHPCPSYMMARRKASKGKSCASAIANVLKELQSKKATTSVGDKDEKVSTSEKCPNCGGGTVHIEGCTSCPECGYSRC